MNLFLYVRPHSANRKNRLKLYPGYVPTIQAQARAAMINAESNAALTPYKMQQIFGDTNFRNIGVGQSGYWDASTGKRSALMLILP